MTSMYSRHSGHCIFKPRNKMRFFLILCFLFLQSHAYAVGEEGCIVIVNKDGPLAEADMEEVRDIYLGEKMFAKGKKVLPVNFTEGPLKDLFLKLVVGLNSKEYKHHWIKKVFQEGRTIPATMGSPHDIIEFVSKEKGAVAYLSAEWVDIIRFGTGQIKPKRFLTPFGTIREESEKVRIPKGIKEIKIIGP